LPSVLDQQPGLLDLHDAADKLARVHCIHCGRE
jgi:hypothetical protein